MTDARWDMTDDKVDSIRCCLSFALCHLSCYDWLAGIASRRRVSGREELSLSACVRQPTSESRP